MDDSLGRILVIDDDPEVVGLFTDYFCDAGYQVVTAGHGGDGLMLAAFERPDVVLLDIRMAGLDGLEVLEELLAQWPALPVVMVSGAGESELAQQCLTRGAFDYVSKPFELEHVHRCVAAAIGGHGRGAAEPGTA